jgi:hypothetical protein
MNQESLPYPAASIYDALAEAVKALGGPKKVGYLLWSDMREKLATDRVIHCLTPQRAEKFSPQEVDELGRRAALVGCHAVMRYFGDRWSYDVRPVSPRDEMAELQRQFIASVETVRRISEKIEQAEQRPTLQVVR